MLQVKEFGDALAELARLQKGWDSYDGDPPSANALAAARCIWPCPMSDGGVQIEFHAGGMDVEIDIGADGKVRGIFVEKLGEILLSWPD